MKRIDLHFKVEVELEPGETAERLAEEVRKLLRKAYGVRRVELTSLQEH